MGKITTWTFYLAAICIFLSGCIVAVVNYSETEGSLPVEEFYHSVAFNPGGTVSLRNFDGRIEIRGWEEDEVEVSAEKMMYRPQEARVSILRRDILFPKIEFDEFEDYINIKTRIPDRRGDNCTVDYWMNVPHSVNLKDIIARDGEIIISDLYGKVFVELRQGDIDVDNFSGSLTASVITGSIQAGLYDLRNEDEIRLTAKQGDITLYLQPDVDAKIEGSFPNGELFCEFEFAEPPTENRLSLQIGEGGASIAVTALNGNINIKKIQ